MAKRSLAKLLGDADRHQQGARAGGDFQKLNRDLMELLGNDFFHLLKFRFHPNYAKLWADAVVRIVCGSHIYSIPSLQLEELVPEKAKKVRKIMESTIGPEAMVAFLSEKSAFANIKTNGQLLFEIVDRHQIESNMSALMLPEAHVWSKLRFFGKSEVLTYENITLSEAFSRASETGAPHNVVGDRWCVVETPYGVFTETNHAQNMQRWNSYDFEPSEVVLESYQYIKNVEEKRLASRERIREQSQKALDAALHDIREQMKARLEQLEQELRGFAEAEKDDKGYYDGPCVMEKNHKVEMWNATFGHTILQRSDGKVIIGGFGPQNIGGEWKKV